MSKNEKYLEMYEKLVQEYKETFFDYLDQVRKKVRLADVEAESLQVFESLKSVYQSNDKLKDKAD